MVTLSFEITSCGGTVRVTVLRSTLTIRSMIGISRIRPGPFWAISRPNRKITPRSYSRRILIDEASTISTKIRSRATIAMATPTRGSLLVYRGRTRSVSPSTDSTRTLLPRSRGRPSLADPAADCSGPVAGGASSALHSAPSTKIWPIGSSGSRTSPTAPIISSQPVRAGWPRARIARSTATAKKPPIRSPVRITTGAETSKALVLVS